VFSFRFWPFCCQASDPSIHWTGDWVGPEMVLIRWGEKHVCSHSLCPGISRYEHWHNGRLPAEIRNGYLQISHYDNLLGPSDSKIAKMIRMGPIWTTCDLAFLWALSRNHSETNLKFLKCKHLFTINLHGTGRWVHSRAASSSYA
jgi:hypothetical protein